MEEKKVKQPSSLTEKERALKAAMEKDAEKVKGIFRFYELPGGILEFCYRKYKDEPLREFKCALNTELRDGQMYELPRGVARHLNSSGRYPEYEYIKDALGKDIMRIKRMVARYGFESTEFIEQDELPNPTPPTLYTVERM